VVSRLLSNTITFALSGALCQQPAMSSMRQGSTAIIMERPYEPNMPPQNVTAIQTTWQPRLVLDTTLPNRSEGVTIPVTLIECAMGSKNATEQFTPGPILREEEGNATCLASNSSTFRTFVKSLCSDLNSFLPDLFEHGGFVGAALHCKPNVGSTNESTIAINEDTWYDVVLMLRSGTITAVRLSAYTWPKAGNDETPGRRSRTSRDRDYSKFVIKARH